MCNKCISTYYYNTPPMKLSLFFVLMNYVISISGGVKTSIKAGTSFNVTWHLGYPHQGGFRLELLDPHEKRLRDFTPTDEYVVGDTT